MTQPRVAIIFDNQARPETTGVYCRRALEQLAEVEHFLPADLSKIPRQGFDLYLVIDDGLRFHWPADLHPCAWWAIDTHLDCDWYLRQGQVFDFVFAAQRDGAEQLRASGLTSVTWLPLACDPEFHRPHQVDKEFDVAFVGNLIPGVRTELLNLIRDQYPNSFVGNCYFDEMARTYSASRIVFNRSARNDVNMRVFEALACGSLLLTNDLADNGQAELFQDDLHFATYCDASDLAQKIDWYLAHPEAGQRIADAGRQEVLSRHTYQHRMRTVLEKILNPGSKNGVPSNHGRTQLKDAFYFEFARPEVAALVPTTARRILDIGCGSGRLGASLKARQHAEVTGIELQTAAALRASQCLDHVVSGNIETGEIAFPDERFDCVICADVLEHLRQPEKVLSVIRRWLAPNGSLVVSIPNVRHHSVLSSLLDGNWTYESAGLLDADHVRFFTRREIEKLLFRAGFEIQQLQPIPGPGYKEWNQEGRPGEVRVGGLQISGLPVSSAEEFFVYQYLLRARPLSRRNEPLTSIIILTHNELSYTRECLDSIRLRTDEPIELILVDNGSTDGTVDYLQTLDGAKVIFNADNRGFPGGVNQGLQVATGQHVLLLNNDCVVTTGWLRRMLDALNGDSTIGLVGPISNNTSGYQQVSVNYRDITGLDGFAWDWGHRNNRKTLEVDRLIGFCLLIRREVIDRIGVLDERFGVGCYEDDDFCRRARQAGYRIVIAADAFVHHYGSRTFAGSGVDFAAILRENEKKYQEKWKGNQQLPDDEHDCDLATASRMPQANVGLRTTSPASIKRLERIEGPSAAPAKDPAMKCNSNFSLEIAQSGGLRLKRKQIRLSLCMIVRDNETTIRPCLESIGPYVDEMIVVDTGSKDRTPDICRELGAKVYEFPWCDDFSAARNESLKRASGEWLFWMDSDDTIKSECGARLRTLVDGRHEHDVLGYVMQVHCPGLPEKGHSDVTVVDHIKLFPNRPELRFEHRIHEQILPSIRRLGGQVVFTDIYVVHSGSDHSQAGRNRKLERDFRLLRLDLHERPNHPFVLFNLGMTYTDAQQYNEAAVWLTRCLEVSRPEESHVAKAYALLVTCFDRLNQFEMAWHTCLSGRDLFPHDKELLFRHAMLAHQSNRLSQAVDLYRQVLTEPSTRQFQSMDADLSGHKARHNLALVYEDLGKFDEAEAQWREILSDNPEMVTAQVALSDFLIKQRKFEAAQATIRLLMQRPDSIAEGFRLASKLEESRVDLNAALKMVTEGVRTCGETVELLREMARLQYSKGDLIAASNTLRRLTNLTADDQSVWNNLGVVLSELQQREHSQDAFKRAQELGHARHKVGV